MKTKPIFLTAAVLALAAFVYAFTADGNVSKKISYCEVIYKQESRGIFLKTSVYVNYATGATRDSLPTFSTVLDAVNHMGGKGWQLVNVYNEGGGEMLWRHYVMERKETGE